jgi:DNA-binding CsgD family transcriptional regulator
MNLDAIFAEFYDAATSREVTFDALLRLAQNVGFSDVAVSVVKISGHQYPKATYSKTSYSERWCKELLALPDDVIRRDPILKHMDVRSDPIAWDRRTYGDSELYLQFRTHGIGSGVAAALPLSGVDQRIYVGFSRADESIESDRHLGGQIAALMLAASLATSAFNNPNDAAKSCPLSVREIEVLRWVREGKSSWDIGVILGISDGTVNSHIRNIGKKFGMSTRMQAVVYATQEKWL